MAKQTFDFFVYEIIPQSLQHNSSYLRDLLLKKFNSDASLVADRRMPVLNTHDELVLTDYSVATDKGLFLGTFMRLTPAENMKHIPDELFKGTRIQAKALESLSEKGNITKTIKYFMVSQNYVITNIPNSRISSLSRYLQWLLNIDKKDSIVLRSKLQPLPSMPLSSIKKIIYTDSSYEKDVPTWQVVRGKLEELMPNVRNLSTILEKQLIKAKLEINVNQLKKQVDDNKKDDVLSVILTPTNVDNIIIELKDKRQIKAGQFVWKEQREIETETAEETIREVYSSLLSCLSKLKEV